MEFRPVSDYGVFHELLTAYYREGEDADTPQEQLDGFIRVLFELVESKLISGAIAWEEEPVGFVLWGMDGENFPFSNKPGYGTILEIGVEARFRWMGYGRQLMEYAQTCLGEVGKYVCAYGPAEAFWKKCGYRESGEKAQNGLKLLVKE